MENTVFKYRSSLVLPAILSLLVLFSCSATGEPPVPASQSPAISAESWNSQDVARLISWARSAPKEALPAPNMHDLKTAIASGSRSAIDQAASALALKLAHMDLFGVAGASQRSGWHIKDSDTSIDLEARLHDALRSGDIDGFFRELLPSHPDYAALRAAYAAETDPARRETIARNMERWRWMPQSLGKAYVFVNTATFEASLWREGHRIKTWRVITGKPSTPSPVFSAEITGVTFNPWWIIPASIVREKHGNFPARLGYVKTASGYRQKPGPNNALGEMKLIMPNPFSVYMHDTPSKSLFAKDVRAFSHGCIRVDEALDFATTLLDGEKSREQVNAIAATRKTTTVGLPAPLPVYITYFTAGLLGDGSFVVQPDIYKRDQRVPAPVTGGFGTECSG